MTGHIEKIVLKKGKISNYVDYVAAFADGTVSEVLSSNTIPHSSEGNYVRIFATDTVHDIQAKLGSL